MLTKTLSFFALIVFFAACDQKPKDQWAQKQEAARGEEAQKLFPDKGQGDYGARDEENVDQVKGYPAPKSNLPPDRKLEKGQNL